MTTAWGGGGLGVTGWHSGPEAVRHAAGKRHDRPDRPFSPLRLPTAFLQAWVGDNLAK